MIFTVSGHQVTIGETVQQYVKDKLESKIKKFFNTAISAHVTFGKDGAFLTAEILINDGVPHQALLTSNGKGLDVRTAFDDANSKTDMQLRKHKELIKSHHKNHHKKPREEL